MNDRFRHSMKQPHTVCEAYKEIVGRDTISIRLLGLKPSELRPTELCPGCGLLDRSITRPLFAPCSTEEPALKEAVI